MNTAARVDNQSHLCGQDLLNIARLGQKVLSVCTCAKTKTIPASHRTRTGQRLQTMRPVPSSIFSHLYQKKKELWRPGKYHLMWWKLYSVIWFWKFFAPPWIPEIYDKFHKPQDGLYFSKHLSPKWRNSGKWIFLSDERNKPFPFIKTCLTPARPPKFPGWDKNSQYGIYC